MDPVDSIIRIDVKMKHEIKKNSIIECISEWNRIFNKKKNIIWVLILFIVSYIKIKWK